MKCSSILIYYILTIDSYKVLYIIGIRMYNVEYCTCLFLSLFFLHITNCGDIFYKKCSVFILHIANGEDMSQCIPEPFLFN